MKRTEALRAKMDL